jgi:threonine dehydrogenase-like Zn-dependent dehydrogenase
MTILVFCEHDVPDHVPERLAKAEGIGAIPINFMEEDPVASIMKLDPNGVDRSCDCVGFDVLMPKARTVRAP